MYRAKEKTADRLISYGDYEIFMTGFCSCTLPAATSAFFNYCAINIGALIQALPLIS